MLREPLSAEESLAFRPGLKRRVLETGLKRRCVPHAVPDSSTALFRPLLRRGFTIIEMLTTVAVLIIVLGLMVSLARYVRNKSANQFTADLLRDLDTAVRRYADHNAGQLPPVTPLIPNDDPVPDELGLHRAARRNNEEFVRALKIYFTPPHSTTAPSQLTNPDTASEFGELPISIYDGVTLRDAWGDPIVFMAHDNAQIGMASRAHPSFFFSAGPDHKYLTRDDNLYSYEAAR